MRLIDADALEELFRDVIGGIAKEPEMTGNLEHMIRASATVVQMIQDAPTVERAEIVRCKDCKHRPIMPDDHTDGFDLKFPDAKCPCQCDDGWYSWYPQDDWFCANGLRWDEIG